MSDIILSQDILETIRIKDYTGKVLSEFSFNPSDANIVERYDSFVNQFEDLEKEILEYEKLNAKDKTYEASKEKLRLVNKKIHDGFNYLLNTEAADSIFSVMGALSPLPSGDYYMTFILEQIGKKIQNATGARISVVNSKIKKYTGKYHA